MLFQSKWRNARYVLKRSTKTITEYGPVIKWGLIAKFRGPQRIFDSERAQEEFGWSDKDREFVENKLLSHQDFGYGLYLAPGEELPENKKKYVKELVLTTRFKRPCQFIWTEDYEVRQCGEEAAVGQTYCAKHDPNEPKIIKGALTTGV